MTMHNMTLEEMHRVQLGIVDEIDHLCAEHNLTYFIAYGSLLGAVRHKGFIPWDDDIDLLMFRKDYEELVAHFDEWSKNGRYKMLTPDNGSVIAFGKVYDSYTFVKETFMREKYCKGVYVDIFILDNVDPCRAIPYKQLGYLALLRGLIITDPSTGSNLPVRVAKKIACPVFSLLDANRVVRKMNSITVDYCPEYTGVVADILGHIRYEQKYTLNADELKPIRLPFEDRMYMAPANYMQLLELEYGDWTQLPPESERIPHVSDAYWLA